MGRKSRHTIKSGDKATKKKQQQQQQQSNIHQTKKSKYDDSMYNEVDQYHLERDHEQEQFINLHQDDNDSDESDNGLGGVEGVMDLGAPDDDDDDDDSESDDDSSSNTNESQQEQDETKFDDSDSDSDSDSLEDLEDDEDNRTKLLNWGKRKKDYYHGDTADLEIGQDFDDAEVEEEAGREIQQMRFERMDDDDFMPFQTKKQHKKHKNIHPQEDEQIQISRTRQHKIQTLDPHEKQRILASEHPEFFPVVSYFTDRFVLELKHTFSLVANQLLNDTKQAEVR